MAKASITKTAAAQNMVAVNFLEKQFGTTITWTKWFIAGVPFSALLSVALYFIMTRMLKPETSEIASGRDAIRAQLEAIGPMSGREWKLLLLVLALLGFWSTEKVSAPPCACCRRRSGSTGAGKWSAANSVRPCFPARR